VVLITADTQSEPIQSSSDLGVELEDLIEPQTSQTSSQTLRSESSQLELADGANPALAGGARVVSFKIPYAWDNNAPKFPKFTTDDHEDLMTFVDHVNQIMDHTGVTNDAERNCTSQVIFLRNGKKLGELFLHTKREPMRSSSRKSTLAILRLNQRGQVPSRFCRNSVRGTAESLSRKKVILDILE
jgi:hypothetical protein